MSTAVNTIKIGLAILGAAAATTLGALGGPGAGTAHAAPDAHPHVGVIQPVTMYGDPAAAAPFWIRQSFDDCALMAAADVIGQLTGRQPSEQEIVAAAHGLASQSHPGPIYTLPTDPNDPNGTGHGTDPRDLPVLLAQYGIHAEFDSAEDTDTSGTHGNGSGIATLERYLAAGRKVIVGVNAELIWGEPVETKDREGDPVGDHAVVVTGIDLATGKVHLNDSGTDDGRDETVPIELFARAWSTSGNEMTVTGEAG